MSKMDKASKNWFTNGSFPRNWFNLLPFTFNYPQVTASIKKEPVHPVSKKRNFFVSLEETNANAFPMAMDLNDDGKVCFDYFTYTEVV
jgi:hypothetical protein